MSTKLHHGYRLNFSAVELFPFLARLRETLTPIGEDVVLRELVLRAAARLDAARAGLPCGDTRRSPIVSALESVNAEVGDSPTRFGFELAVLADPADPSCMYALCFSSVSVLVDAFEASEGVESFPYWNNTDRPDDVTEQDWDARAGLWDRLLGCDAPAQRGVVWSLHGTNPIPGFDRDRLAAMLPERSARAGRLATALAAAEAPSATNSASASEIMRFIDRRRAELMQAADDKLGELHVDDLFGTI